MGSRPRSVGEQMSLLRTAGAPVAVRPRALGWARRRTMASYVAATAGAALKGAKGFQLRALAQDEALLTELRTRTRRRGRKAAAAFAATLAGRRAHRMMDALNERIAAERESVLCG